MGMPISGVLTIRQFLGVEPGTILPYISRGNPKELPLKPDREYNIPGYQRALSWGKENAQILLKDIQESKKFLGNILLSTSDEKLFDIIDGQQRLTIIIMILECLQKNDLCKLNFKYCKFTNDTFEKFNDLLACSFLPSAELKKGVDEIDVLYQYDTFVSIWNVVNNYISSLDKIQIDDLANNILNSSICVIVSEIETGDEDTRRVCVDYFIDINNKSVELDHVDILKAYAFRHDFETITKQWIVITELLKKLDEYNVSYNMEILYLHYMLCTINKNKLLINKGISDEYKLLEDVVLQEDNITYYKGTDIELLISDPAYYVEMFDNLVKYLKFIIMVLNDKMGPSNDFCNMFITSEGASQPVTCSNAFSIINSIIRNSDSVPKLLLMKYYLDVLSGEVTSERINSIYWINVLAVCFSASPSKSKNIASFAKLVLKQDFFDEIKKQAYNRMIKYPGNIGFGKEVSHGKTNRTTCGQMLSRRVYTLEAYTCNNGGIEVKADTFSNSISSSIYNDEHFIINESEEYKFNYHKKELKFSPKIQSSYVTFIGNFLKLRTDINTELGNKMIKDKLQIIQRHIDAGEKNVFGNNMSALLFGVAKKVFSNSECKLTSELDKCTSEQEAIDKASEYYTTQFETDYKEYIDQVCDMASVITDIPKKITKSFYVKIFNDGDEVAFNVATNYSIFEGVLYSNKLPVYRIQTTKAKKWETFVDKVLNKELDMESIEDTDLEKLANMVVEPPMDLSSVNLNDIFKNLINVEKLALYAVINQNKEINFFSDQNSAMKFFLENYASEEKKWIDMAYVDFKGIMAELKSNYKPLEIKRVSDD